jgi:hypothetical protein
VGNIWLRRKSPLIRRGHRSRRSGGHLGRGQLRFLKARSAKHRPTLRRPERHGGFRAACRTLGPCLRAHPHAPAGSLGFALLAPLRVVLEILVVKEQLFTRSEDKLGSAIDTLQYSVSEFHGRLPKPREIDETALTSVSAGPVSLFSYVFGKQGPGPREGLRQSRVRGTERAGETVPVTHRHEGELRLLTLNPGRHRRSFAWGSREYRMTDPQRLGAISLRLPR